MNEPGERLSAVETKVDGLVEKVSELVTEIRADRQRLEPLIHSDPPVMNRLRAIEDAQLVQRTQVRSMAFIATFVSPVATALIVKQLGG